MDIVIAENSVRSKIHTIRGQQVILDRDLASLYNIETRVLKQAVNRNIRRFPEDFMFILTEEEVKSMVSQNVIPSKQHLGGSLPYAFTEHGVANLASILTSDKAIEVNIQIIRAFISMKKIISANADIFNRLDKVEMKQIEYDARFKELFDTIQHKIKPEKGIFYDGQVFDAYKFVCDLIRSATRSIILMDNYIDDTVLEMLSKRGVGVEAVIYTAHVSHLDLQKYHSQYPAVVIKEFKKNHDRFLIIDDVVYHFGASLKDLGRRWFAFCKLDLESVRMMERVR